MASALRQKYTAKYPQFGEPPTWVSDNDLGKVSRQTAGALLGDLGVGSFQGTGNDYVQDVLNFLTAAIQTSILNGLFTNIIRRNNSVEVFAAPDMYGSSSGGAIMLKFIRALLADAEKSGKIAIPKKTSVLPGPDRKSVIVKLDL